jgi:ketosteroid isomerase-like protein
MVTSAARSRCVAFAALLLAGGTQAADFEDLVAAERAFAADAAARSVRDAFLAALADEGVVFAPGPVNAQRAWSARPADTTRLEWAPEAAEISASGDLGYTYGPWRLTRPGDDAPKLFGHYFTVWQKQPDGHWKAIADKGVAHKAMPLPTTVVRRGQLNTSPAPATPPAAARIADLRAGVLLPAGRVLHEVVSSDFVRLRGNELPSAESEAPALKLGPAARLDGGLVISAAGDLAVTWGGGAGGGWLRVWRRAGVGDPPGQTWRLAADVSDAVVPPPPADE